MLSKDFIRDYAKEIISIDKNLFEIFYDNDENKFIFGNMSPQKENEINKWFKCRALHLTAWDLMCKIGMSYGAISSLDLEAIEKDYEPCTPVTKEEFGLFYYLENIIYRQITLWDLLAQFYNIHYNINLDIKQIEYKRFFNNYSKKNFGDIKIISDYVRFDTDCENIKTHQYISEYRNSLTHRISDSVPSMSNIGVHIKEHPINLIEYLIEDLKQFQVFYHNLLEDILSEQNVQQLLDIMLSRENIGIIKF